VVRLADRGNVGVWEDPSANGSLVDVYGQNCDERFWESAAAIGNLDVPGATAVSFSLIGRIRDNTVLESSTLAPVSRALLGATATRCRPTRPGRAGMSS
jgi:hypothetical protein